jgi:hypothetical protein
MIFMRTKRGSNKIMMMVIALMLIITSIGISKKINFASTGNITDETWSLNLSVTNTTWQFLMGRNKLNNSKIYINWSTSYGTGKLTSIYIAPCGSDKADSSPHAAGTSSGGGAYYVMESTGKYAMTNYVYELGYHYARPAMRAKSGSGTAQGYWSPDCAGSYTVLK